jgi:hypothetical protein
MTLLQAIDKLETLYIAYRREQKLIPVQYDELRDRANDLAEKSGLGRAVPNLAELIHAPLRWRRTMAELRTEAEPPPDGHQRSSSEAPLDARALAVFIKHPDWTKVQIAEHLRCNEKSLTPKRCPKLASAMAASKAKIDPTRRRIRGSKDHGNLEAYDDG